MTRTPLVAFLERLERLVAGIGKLASWLILPVLLAVLFSIAAGVFRINKFAEWEQTLPVFGNALTMNSMLELQWHLFGILLLLTGAYALSENRHVRVDVLSSKFSPRGRLMVEIIGDLVFLLPLCILLIDRSLPLLELSFRTGERSNEDGLTHRYLIKSLVPIGFFLLALLGSSRIIRHIIALFQGDEAIRAADYAHDDAANLETHS